jgi:thiamine pyrophosphokinase
VLARLPRPAAVIAADSGLNHAERLGLRPGVVIGDMDSASPSALAAARDAGATIERHPADKDATDLELALGYAAARGFTHAVLLGGHGGRLSHLLGNALLLTSPLFAALRIEWHVRATTVTVVRPSHEALIHGTKGDLVSLLATDGPAQGIRTTGLRWALGAETLTTGSTRGISNEMTDDQASVWLDDGVLLAIHERRPST